MKKFIIAFLALASLSGLAQDECTAVVTNCSGNNNNYKGVTVGMFRASYEDGSVTNQVSGSSDSLIGATSKLISLKKKTTLSPEEYVATLTYKTTYKDGSQDTNKMNVICTEFKVSESKAKDLESVSF